MKDSIKRVDIRFRRSGSIYYENLSVDIPEEVEKLGEGVLHDFCYNELRLKHKVKIESMYVARKYKTRKKKETKTG